MKWELSRVPALLPIEYSPEPTLFHTTVFDVAFPVVRQVDREVYVVVWIAV
jgi:hypothetical protein